MQSFRHQAITYYSQCRNTEKLVECYYIAENYDQLEKIIYNLPDNHKLLMVQLFTKRKLN
jgi:hypothetical protein